MCSELPSQEGLLKFVESSLCGECERYSHSLNRRGSQYGGLGIPEDSRQVGLIM